jgi:hypothetical protein
MHSTRQTLVFQFLCAVTVLLPTAAKAAIPHLTLQSAVSAQHASDTPGCEGADARQCLERALEAMGGRERLTAVNTVRLDEIGHTAVMEQSYRQAPFYASYERDQTIIDHAGQRLFQKQHSVWPESDLKGADSDITLIVTPAGGVYRSNGKESPCGGGDLDASRQALALGPERILLTAGSAADLRFLPAETVRSTPHTVLAFTWNSIPVRILLNQFNHLPDAVETRQEFQDFWFYWGDVDQRIYFDNWRLVHGIEYPSNQITERNGAVWSSSQALDIEFNTAVENKDFEINPKAAQASTQAKGWKASFRSDHDKQLAPGVDLFLGSWNTTIVKQTDGIVILETPISGTYTEGILAEAKKRYPGEVIKAVLTTSDSWPHVGGVRYDVAQELPIYVLDLNQPLLDHMLDAQHTLDPDPLQTAKKSPHWKVVSGRTEIGSGENRMVLFPIRGASTERQYMVYFPERRLLYASDTLVLNSDNSLYDPELMREVQQAVDREHLVVDTVYAMHQAPTPWNDVVSLIKKANDAGNSTLGG